MNKKNVKSWSVNLHSKIFVWTFFYSDWNTECCLNCPCLKWTSSKSNINWMKKNTELTSGWRPIHRIYFVVIAIYRFSMIKINVNEPIFDTHTQKTQSNLQRTRSHKLPILWHLAPFGNDFRTNVFWSSYFYSWVRLWLILLNIK